MSLTKETFNPRESKSLKDSHSSEKTTMTIHQLSVFLENTSGTLVEVLRTLKSARVQLIATTIADTAEYGILRIICAEPLRACEALKQAGFAVAVSDVFALRLENHPGSASDAVEFISKAGLSITYIYTFLYRDEGILIFRTDNPDLARKTIISNDLPLISEAEFEQWR